MTRRQPSTSVNARGQSCRDLAISPYRHPSPHAWIQFSRHATRYVVKRKMGVACEKRLGGRLRSTQRKERRRNALAPPPPTGSDAGPRVRGRYMSSVNVTFMLGLSTGRGGPAMVCLEEKKTMRRGYCRETTFRSLDILDPSSTQRGNRVSQLPGIHFRRRTDNKLGGSAHSCDLPSRIFERASTKRPTTPRAAVDFGKSGWYSARA